MRNELTVKTADEYIFELGLDPETDIDWDETGTKKIPYKQYQNLQRILACESSIFALRRLSHSCGSLADTMIEMRRALINRYEKNYCKYIEHNDFY